MSTKSLAFILTIAASGLFGSGCNDPRAEKPYRTRLDRIDRYVEASQAREAEGPRRLAHIDGLIARESRMHDEHLRRDLKRVEVWSIRDCQRWQDRQPIYRASMQDLWDGDLENADRTVPHLFY